MECEIRKATKKDAPSLANIIVESWKSAYSDLIPRDEISKFLDKKRRQEQFERFIENGEIVLIGLYKKRPFGLVFANRDNDEQLEECGSIYSIYLLEEYWGKGLATGLMKIAIDVLKGEGRKQVSLWVYKENIRARKFYEKYSHFSNKPMELRYIKEI